MRSEKLCWQLSQKKSTLLHIATGYFHFWMHLKVVKLALFIDTITLTFVNQVFEHVYIRPRVDQKVLDFFVNLFFIVKRSVLQWRWAFNLLWKVALFPCNLDCTNKNWKIVSKSFFKNSLKISYVGAWEMSLELCHLNF